MLLITGKPIPLTNAKTGTIYTRNAGFEKSKAIEIVEKNGISLDVGSTKTSMFVGVSKDIISTKNLEVDIGAGITTKKDPFFGAHFKIQF